MYVEFSRRYSFTTTTHVVLSNTRLHTTCELAYYGVSWFVQASHHMTCNVLCHEINSYRSFWCVLSSRFTFTLTTGKMSKLGLSRKRPPRGAAFSRMSFDVMGLHLLHCLRLTVRPVPW